MNKYRSALNKINVTPEMEKRIIETLSKEYKAIKEDNVKKFRYSNWFKPIGIAAACCFIIASLTVLYPSILNYTQNVHEIQSVNPIVDTKEIKDLKKEVKFELITPSKLPIGYKFSSATVIAGSLAQIEYSNGKDIILYRMAKGADDVSGDYTIYANSKVVKLGAINVTLKRNNALVNLATWTNNNKTFSISSLSGLQDEVVVSIVESIK